MKKLNIFGLFLLVILSFSCSNEDYYISDLKSSERAIVAAKIKNQVGAPVITRANDASTVKVMVFGKIDDLKTLAPEFALSFKSTIEPASGTPVDFTVNPEHSIVYTVTSQSGEKRQWTVTVDLFKNDYEGQWGIKNYKCLWDDGNGYGLKGETEVALKITNAAPGLDDKLIFKSIEGVSETGSVYGSYERTVGADGKFGTYISPKGTDWSAKFGQLPNGKGKYFINPDNSISIIIDGTTTKLTSKGCKITNGATMTYELNAPKLSNSTLEWGDNYFGTENILRMTYSAWYVLAKE